MQNPDPLKTLQDQIDEAKRHAGIGKNPNPTDMGQEGIGRAVRLGVELLAGLVVGCVMGYYLDRWFGTFPWFFIVCFFLGAAAGFKNLLREANQMSDEENKQG